MIREEFLTTLKLLDVKEKGGEFRIKGFLLEYVRSPIFDYVLLKGKIPYSLAKAIYEQHKKYKIDMEHFIFSPYEDKDDPIEKFYIDRITIKSVEALQFVIETIREYPIINEWAIGNY